MKYILLPLLFVVAFGGFAQESSPLIEAVESNNLSQVKTLVEAGADVNAFDRHTRSAVEIAIRKENLTMMKCLIESGAKSTSGLYDAVRADNLPLTKYLIEQDFHIGQAVVYTVEKIVWKW